MGLAAAIAAAAIAAAVIAAAAIAVIAAAAVVAAIVAVAAAAPIAAAIAPAAVVPANAVAAAIVAAASCCGYCSCCCCCWRCCCCCCCSAGAAAVVTTVDVVGQSLNYVILAGSLVVRLPQIIAIFRAQSIAGISEASVLVEALSSWLFVIYNLLQRHSFKTWGEALFIAGLLLLSFFSFLHASSSFSLPELNRSSPAFLGLRPYHLVSQLNCGSSSSNSKSSSSKSNCSSSSNSSSNSSSSINSSDNSSKSSSSSIDSSRKRSVALWCYHEHLK
ncbi:hypothetical protein Emed_002114 [Eimeria media]